MEACLFGRKISTHIVFLGLMITLVSYGCNQSNGRMIAQPLNWTGRIVDEISGNASVVGSTYLSVYSEIYIYSENDFRPMTATISIRNTNRADTVFVNKIEYFNTHGTLVKSYIDNSIFIAPMETVEIVIGQMDLEGGTGANFYFDWAIARGVNAPFFEGIMVSHTGAQAFSFVTQGQRVD